MFFVSFFVILANLPEKYSIFPILPHPTVIPYIAHNNAKQEVGHITGNQSQKITLYLYPFYCFPHSNTYHQCHLYIPRQILITKYINKFTHCNHAVAPPTIIPYYYPLILYPTIIP